MYEANGTIKLIEETQTFPSGFSKREFVVTTDHDKYPQDIKFEVMKDKCELLDAYEPGQPVKVFFDIRGNEYNGRYYVNLNAWKLEGASNGAPAMPPSRSADPLPTDFDDPDDAIPF